MSVQILVVRVKDDAGRRVLTGRSARHRAPWRPAGLARRRGRRAGRSRTHF